MITHEHLSGCTPHITTTREKDFNLRPSIQPQVSLDNVHLYNLTVSVHTTVDHI